MYHKKRIAASNAVLTSEFMHDALEPDIVDIFRDITRRFVAEQVKVFVRPEVDLDSSHLRNLRLIHELTQYPRDHWEGHKQILLQRYEENAAYLPECILKEHQPATLASV